MAIPAPLSPDTAQSIADRFRLLGEPMRLRILYLLCDGEKSVGTLAEALDCTQANVSKHLALMTDAGVLRRRRDGVHSFYAVADTSVFGLCESVCDCLRTYWDARAGALPR
jgi:DNA-binding transcriptional ArsR family regulator